MHFLLSSPFLWIGQKLTSVERLWPDANLWPWWSDCGWTLTSYLGGVVVARVWPLTLVGWWGLDSDLWPWWGDCGQTLTSVEWLLPDVDLCELFAARCWSLNSMGWLWPDADLWPWWDIFTWRDLQIWFSEEPQSLTLVQSSNADSLCFSAKIVPPWSPYCDLALAVHCGSSDCRNSTVNWGGGQGNIFGNTYSFSPFSLS